MKKLKFKTHTHTHDNYDKCKKIFFISCNSKCVGSKPPVVAAPAKAGSESQVSNWSPPAAVGLDLHAL